MKGLTQFGRAMAAGRIVAVNQERERLLADPGEDPVHDLRVSLRRLEPVFELFDIEPLGFDTAATHERVEQWLRGAGKVRDCDVVLPLIPGEFAERLSGLRGERADELVRLLESHGPLEGPRGHVTAKGGWREPEVIHFAAIALPHSARAYFRSGFRAVAKKRSLRRLHEFRLHGKSLRYSLELFEPLYGEHLKTLQRMLKRMQTVLGEMADARAGLKLLKKLGAPEEAGLGLRELAGAKREEFSERWQKDVPDVKYAAQWVEYLRRFPRARD